MEREGERENAVVISWLMITYPSVLIDNYLYHFTGPTGAIYLSRLSQLGVGRHNLCSVGLTWRCIQSHIMYMRPYMHACCYVVSSYLLFLVTTVTTPRFVYLLQHDASPLRRCTTLRHLWSSHVSCSDYTCLIIRTLNDKIVGSWTGLAYCIGHKEKESIECTL